MGKTKTVPRLRWTIRFEASADIKEFPNIVDAVVKGLDALETQGTIVSLQGPTVVRVPVQ